VFKLQTADALMWMQSSDPDVKAAAARIKQFVLQHAYLEPPEGSQLPEYDQSADVRV